MSVTIAEIRAQHRSRASSLRMDPRDVDVLLADALGRDLAWIIAHDDEPIQPEAAERLERSLEKRFRGEPLQYVRGFCEFYGREFLTDTRALVPRPETEHLVEEVLRNTRRGARVIDLGTGAGAIGISVALERPDLEVFASDVSLDALALARTNIIRLGAKVALFASDVLDAVATEFDVIATNPPYVPEREIPGLQIEVRNWEPRVALTAGADEYRVIRRIVDDSPSRLRPGGIVIMEIGFRQREDVERIARRAGWREVVFADDLAMIPRVAVLSGWTAAAR